MKVTLNYDSDMGTFDDVSVGEAFIALSTPKVVYLKLDEETATKLDEGIIVKQTEFPNEGLVVVKIEELSIRIPVE